MDVVQISPRQLRAVAGNGWSIPVHCDPYSDDGREITHYRVAPAMELMAGPFSELSSLFQPVNQSESTRYWVVEASFTDKTTRRVEGCCPEDYLCWAEQSPDTLYGTVEKTSDLIVRDEPFLKYLCKSAGMDPVIGRYFWAALKKSVVKWLVQEQKPIHFGPFTVHPMPYRDNWKEILLAKHSGSNRHFFRLKDNKNLRKALLEDGFTQDLGSVDLIAMDHGRFNWTLDLEIQPVLAKAFAQAEIERLTTKRNVKYAKYYEGCIRRRLEDIIKVYSVWLHRIKMPVGRLSESPVSGNPILLSSTRRDKVLPSWHYSHAKRPTASGEAPTLRAEPSKPRHVESKTKKLFDMSNLQPDIPDLRQCAESNLGGGGDKDSSGGMLLLHAPESSASGGGLLDQGKKPGE